MQLAQASAPRPVELISFDGADHCGGSFADRAAYIALVTDFLDRWLVVSRTQSRAGRAANMSPAQPSLVPIRCYSRSSSFSVSLPAWSSLPAVRGMS